MTFQSEAARVPATKVSLALKVIFHSKTSQFSLHCPCLAASWKEERIRFFASMPSPHTCITKSYEVREDLISCRNGWITHSRRCFASCHYATTTTIQAQKWLWLNFSQASQGDSPRGGSDRFHVVDGQQLHASIWNCISTFLANSLCGAVLHVGIIHSMVVMLVSI